MNDGKINLGEALAEIERQLIPKADKNFKNKYHDRLYDYLFKDSIVKIPKGCHAVSLGPSQKIVSVLREVVGIYLNIWIAIIKNSMIEINELEKQQGNPIKYEIKKIKKITPQILFKWEIFSTFLRGEMNLININSAFDYSIVINKIPVNKKGGKIIFESNLESKVEVQRLQNLLIDFIPFKKKGKLLAIKYEKERALLFKMLNKADSLTTRYYDLSFEGIYSRGLYMFENLKSMFFMKEFKIYKSKTKTKDLHGYLRYLEKENPGMSIPEFYDRYGEEILNKAGKLWDEFALEQKEIAIYNYLRFNKSGESTLEDRIEAENYWNGKIENIPPDNYFNYKNAQDEKKSGKKIEVVPNKFIGTNNRDFAAMEYKLLNAGSSKDEFNKYYDCYNIFVKKLRLRDNPMQVSVMKDNMRIMAKDEEIRRFEKAKDANIYFNGSTKRIDSLGLRFVKRQFNAIRKRKTRLYKK